MADTAIEITAGTGTQVDTRTEATNGHHRQVVVLGDPSTNAGVAAVDASAGLKVNLGADNDVTIAGDAMTALTDSLAALVAILAKIIAAPATEAKQDTIIGHVDGLEGLLTTIDGDTGTISTRTTTIAGAVSGTEMQVDVVAALPAGTNNIGDVDVLSLPALPAGNNNIGDVDIASALPAGDNNIGNVDIVTLPALAAGTNNIGDVDVLTLPAIPTGSNTIGGVNLTQYTPASGRLPVDPSGVTQPVSNAGLTALIKPLDGDYETVAASQTDQMMGATGAAGDYLAGVLIIPATVSPGLVSIEDGSTNIVIFAGGTDSVLTLHPFYVPLGIISVSGGWEITTGANVSCIGVGSFT